MALIEPLGAIATKILPFSAMKMVGSYTNQIVGELNNLIKVLQFSGISLILR